MMNDYAFVFAPIPHFHALTIKRAGWPPETSPTSSDSLSLSGDPSFCVLALPMDPTPPPPGSSDAAPLLATARDHPSYDEVCSHPLPLFFSSCIRL